MTQNSIPQTQYASLNRRLVAAVLDLLLVLIIIVPTTNWVVSFIANGGDIPSLIATYLEIHKDDVIKISDLIQYLESRNAIVPYILSQLISLLMVMAYCLTFWSWKGATLGKIMLRIKIIDIKSGGPITIRQGIIRVIGYIVSSVIFAIGFIMINFRKDRRGLHDIMAGTEVIVEKLR